MTFFRKKSGSSTGVDFHLFLGWLHSNDDPLNVDYKKISGNKVKSRKLLNVLFFSDKNLELKL